MIGATTSQSAVDEIIIISMIAAMMMEKALVATNVLFASVKIRTITASSKSLEYVLLRATLKGRQ